MGAVCAVLCCGAHAGDISNFAGGGSGGQYATRVGLVFPVAVAAGNNGDVYIADQRSVRRVNGNGIISTLAGGAAPGYSGDGGPATAALLNDPRGLAVDAVGNVYIADSYNHRVRRVAANGTIVTVAGNGVPGSGGDGGAATAASLHFPAGVAVDAAGVLYIADTLGNRIRRVGLDGIITTAAGDGGGSISGDGGQAALARVAWPHALVFDRHGNLFIADTGNGRIRKITPGGIISTVAGGGSDPDSGVATTALLSTPFGVAVDAAGNLFVVEKDRHRIRKVSVDGALSTLAGNGNAGFAGDGGPVAGAIFNLPMGVVADPYGNLLVADSGNHRVRRIASDAADAPLPVGSGAFRAAQRVPLTYTPSLTAIGDVTGDGRDDLVTATFDGGQDPNDDYTLQIYVQQSNGQLAAPVRLRYGALTLWSSKLVLADLNKDGLLDIVIAHQQGFSVVAGNRSASFTVKNVSGPTSAYDQYMTVAVTDANRDGHPDVIVGNSPHQGRQYVPASRIYYGDGSGSFPSHVPLQTQYQGINDIAVGDFNGDGIEDLAALTASASRIEVLLHDGVGGFSPNAVIAGINSLLTGLRASDFDDDGRQELIVSESPMPYTKLRRLQFVSGSGWQNAEYIPVPSGNSGVSLVADLNGDGRDDFMTNDQGQLLYSQQTDFGLANHVAYALPGAVSGPTSLAAGDLDHDGCKDVVGGGGDRGLWFLYGVGCSRAGTVADDVDNDGRSDLLLHSRAQQALQSRSMLGSRSIGSSLASVPSQYYIVAKGDLTGDGRVDFVWTSDDRLMWLWRSQPGGTYAVEFIRTFPPQGWTLVGAGDVNGDGKDDLLWHNPFLQQMDYWLMDGSTILNYGQKEVASRYFPIAKGDFDGDGRADIVWTSIDLDVIWMWRGVAGGGFSIHQVAAYPPRGWSVVGAGDVNGDGKDDLLWHNRALQRADYWLMDGPQRVGVGIKEVASRYFVVATGDYNGDGRLDVVWTSDDRDDLWLWRGEPGGTFAIERIGAFPAGDWRLVREPGYLQ